VNKPVESLDLFAPEGPDYVHIEDKVPEPLSDNDLDRKRLAGNIAAFLDLTGYSKNSTDPHDPARVKYQNLATRIEICGQYWRPKECPNGHGEILSRIYCDLPYCPTCGKRHSQVHKKRIKRVQKMLLGFPALGHWVFTMPKDLSNSLPSSAQINQLYKIAYQLLNIYLGAEAAMIVLHFCGDKSNGLHLHFDCTFPILSGHAYYFPPDLLRQLRYDWTVAVNKLFDIRTDYRRSWIKDHFAPWGRRFFSLPGDYEGYFPNETESDIYVGHYNYALELGKQLNLLDYVTRSTITAEKFIDLSPLEKEWVIDRVGKKVIRYQGELGSGKKKDAFLAKYQHPFVWELVERMQEAHDEEHGRIEAEKRISEGCCPVCGAIMKWVKGSKKIHVDDISGNQFFRYDQDTFIDRRFQWHMKDEYDEFNRRERLKETLEEMDLIDRLYFEESERVVQELTARDAAEMDLAAEES
jgi:hypothetical protein